VPRKDGPNRAEEIHIPNYTMLDFGFPKGEKASYKDSPNGAEDMYISDYVMVDFGFSEGMRIGRNPRSR